MVGTSNDSEYEAQSKTTKFVLLLLTFGKYLVIKDDVF